MLGFELSAAPLWRIMMIESKTIARKKAVDNWRMIDTSIGPILLEALFGLQSKPFGHEELLGPPK